MTMVSLCAQKVCLRTWTLANSFDSEMVLRHLQRGSGHHRKRRQKGPARQQTRRTLRRMHMNETAQGGLCMTVEYI